MKKIGSQVQEPKRLLTFILILNMQKVEGSCELQPKVSMPPMNAVMRNEVLVYKSMHKIRGEKEIQSSPTHILFRLPISHLLSPKTLRKTMKGRVRTPPTDLLVCFPSSSRLTVMPKPICGSPSRPTTQILKRHHPSLFRTANRPNPSKNQLGSDIASEPTSPKVTCAGQIKVRHKNRNSCQPAPKNWIDTLGLKKDVTNFLGVLRSSMRFNMHCFGSLHGVVDSCSDDDEVEDEVEGGGGEGGGESNNIFSKWFMMLEENQVVEEEEEKEVELPPKNALLLMRCRSAPSKEVKERRGDEERLMLMSYAPDFFKVSTEIAKETWVDGSVYPLMARSRSWKR